MISSNKNGFCWREECGKSGKRCAACRAQALVANAVENSPDDEIDKQKMWPWIAAFIASVVLAGWILASAGCASVPASDVINDAADALKLAQCVDDVVKDRNTRLRSTTAVAISDAGVPAHIDTKDPYQDAGTAVPEWFSDGGH